jgi:hypothetical protein
MIVFTIESPIFSAQTWAQSIKFDVEIIFYNTTVQRPGFNSSSSMKYELTFWDIQFSASQRTFGYFWQLHDELRNNYQELGRHALL